MHTVHRILLLEDDLDEAERSRLALAENGFAVVHASTLAAARRAVRKDAFDLVIADHHLPDGEGPTIVPYLRATGSSAPVVLVTANRSERVAQAAFAAGCVDAAIKDLGYHAWLPHLAFALVRSGSDGVASRWGPHVIGTCTGCTNGQGVRSTPEGLWADHGPTLQATMQLAARAARSSGQSLLGSLPRIHVESSPGLHLLVATRGGLFAAAMLNRSPSPEDWQELLAIVASLAKARADARTGDSAGS